MERTPVYGGLKLPRSTGVSEQTKQEARSKWDTIGEVEDELASQGFTELDRPPFQIPSVTAEQLTTVINKDYTTLYAQHLRWVNYTSPILAKVKARLLGVRNEMTDIETYTRKELRRKNRELPKEERFNEKDIDDEIWSDPRYNELKQIAQRLEQKKIELDSYLETMDNNMKVISRQVEIRKLEMEGDRRENGMPGRGSTWRAPRTNG